MEHKPKIGWKEENGTVLYGMTDLNKNVQSLDVKIDEHNKHLKKYYKLAIAVSVSIIGIIIWILWQIKKYKIITLLINNL